MPRRDGEQDAEDECNEINEVVKGLPKRVRQKASEVSGPSKSRDEPNEEGNEGDCEGLDDETSSLE